MKLHLSIDKLLWVTTLLFIASWTLWIYVAMVEQTKPDDNYDIHLDYTPPSE